MNLERTIIVYCPVCGLVAAFKNISETIIFPEQLHDGKCLYCGHKMIECKEPYENFYVKKENIHEELFMRDIYIQKKYIINNPLYDQGAHIERLLDRIERNTNQGYKSPYELKELEEICGVHMEQPEVTATPKSFYAPSSTVKCPRCGSTSVTTQKKGFGVGKAAAGVLAVGLAGALAGGIGANKAVNVCQKCGHKWSPGGR